MNVTLAPDISFPSFVFSFFLVFFFVTHSCYTAARLRYIRVAPVFVNHVVQTTPHVMKKKSTFFSGSR